VVGRHDLGHQRAERGAEERLARAVEHRKRHEVPDLEHAGERERSGDREHHRAGEVGRDQDAPALEAIADDPAREQEGGHASGPRKADQRQGHRVVVDVVDLPCLGDDEDPVAEQ
jgi:hypothetical protein